MPKIKILDEITACRIAAGEVVERPVSVVKELVENSLDAGADNVTVTLTGGGADSITVIDNGCGISQEDAPLAFHRHATSKISTAADLDHIETLGFRGEALPSIAAVSDLQIRTRTAQSDEGYYMRVRGGAITGSGPAGCPVGTAVAVNDLFFNTPARRKHMKTKSTEGGLIADLIYKLSLTRPGVRFTMEQQGRTVFRSPGTGKLLDAIAAVYEIEAAGMMVPVNAVEGDLTVTGYVSKPELNRGTRQQITLAVNGRLVRSALVNQALDEAYKGLITIGRYPLAVLQLQLPAGLIDVNVHPAKTEIKIENELQLARLLITAVRSALGKASLIPAAGPALMGKTSLPASAEPFKLSFDTVDKPSSQPGYVMEISRYAVEAEEELSGSGDAGPANDPVNTDHQPPMETKAPASAGYSSEPESAGERQVGRHAGFPSLRVVGQLLNMYIICDSEDGAYLIDQHAAHERVLFEKYHARLQNNSPQVQYLMAPLSINIKAYEKELLQEHRRELEALGFVLDDFGRESLLLRGIPGESSPGDSEGLIADLVETILEQGKPGGAGVEFALSALLACKAAVKAGEKLAVQAMQSLVDQLAMAVEPFTCPHGRPTLVSISRRELNAMFKRT